MSIDSERDVEALKRVGRVVALALRAMREGVREGVTTGELDEIGAGVLAEHGARSAPQMIYDFPRATCISVNDEAVHGVPGPRALRPGDLATLDVTAELDGYFADAAITVGVPPVAPLGRRLMECAQAALEKAIRSARAGAPLSAIGGAVETEVRRRGFKVLRELCGHGIGRSIHEEPSVLNYFDWRSRQRLSEGLVITIEPLISATSERTRTAADRWTILSGDGSISAHFEHTLIITRNRPLILTAA